MEGDIGFVIKQVTTEQFAIVQEAHFPDRQVQLLGAFRFGINTELKTIAAFSQFRFEQAANPFLIVEVGCHFSVHEPSWNKFLDIKQNKFIPDKGFMTHLLAITIGTTRGVLHSKTENSKFSQFLLPTIDVNNAMKDTILEFSLGKQLT